MGNMVTQARPLRIVDVECIADVDWAEEQWKKMRQMFIEDMRGEWEGRQGKLFK